MSHCCLVLGNFYLLDVYSHCANRLQTSLQAPDKSGTALQTSLETADVYCKGAGGKHGHPARNKMHQGYQRPPPRQIECMMTEMSSLKSQLAKAREVVETFNLSCKLAGDKKREVCTRRRCSKLAERHLRPLRPSHCLLEELYKESSD